MGYLQTDRTTFRIGSREPHRRAAHGARARPGITGPDDGCFRDCRSREIAFAQEGSGSCGLCGQEYRHPSPTDASVKDLRKASFQARTFQGFQLRPECTDVLVTHVPIVLYSNIARK